VNAREKVLDKIRKLLALAKGGVNANECAVAAAAAQRLMTRYAIDAAVVEAMEREQGQDRPERFETRWILHGKGPIPAWVMILCNGIVAASDCQGAVTTGKSSHGYQAYGPPEALETMEELTSWLVGEVERLTAEARRYGYRSDDGREGKSYWAAFKDGCASKIRERLVKARDEAREAARREAEGPTDEDYAEAMAQPDKAETIVDLDKRRTEAKANPYALARVQAALEHLETRPARIEEWQKKQGMRFGTVTRQRKSAAAGFASGQKAGQRANLRPGKGLPGPSGD
jgi:hypothetical protein